MDLGTGRALMAAALLAGCAAPPPRAPVAGAFEAAPTPDAAAAAPYRPRGVEVAPTVVSPYQYGLPTDGFPTGSVYGNREDDPTSRGPGVRVSVPTGF